MLENKHVFWQAFVIASVIFWIGILIGVYFEKSRIEDLNKFYFDSETDISDFGLASEIVYNSNLSCNIINEKSVFFADKIYLQARELEKYDESNKITSELISLHRRYDFLRVVLWRDIIEVKKKCGQVNTVVYLYQYSKPDLATKAVQETMSNYLLDLKEKYRDKVILIPIAVDTNVESLNVLRDSYSLNKYPVIFVNEKYKFETIESLETLEKYLN